MRKLRCKVDGEMGEIFIYENVIDGNLDLSGMDLEELPDLSDVTVTGSFKCAYNRLRTLKGAPRKVGRNFDCHGNVLYTLKGAPPYVGNNFDCRDNYLNDLTGGPQHVGGDFDCSNNHSLETLKDAPQFVGGDFICRGDVSLTPKSKLDLPKNIRGRCEIECSEQSSVAEQEVEVRSAYFSEEKCAIVENLLAKFKQEHPELFEITKTGETEKDTAENNSVSLAIKTKKKILDRARQKSKQKSK